MVNTVITSIHSHSLLKKDMHHTRELSQSIARNIRPCIRLHALVPNHHELPVHPIASCQLAGTQRRQLEGKLEDNVPESLSLWSNLIETESQGLAHFSKTVSKYEQGPKAQPPTPGSQHQAISHTVKRKYTLFVGGSIDLLL